MGSLTLITAAVSGYNGTEGGKQAFNGMLVRNKTR